MMDPNTINYSDAENGDNVLHGILHEEELLVSSISDISITNTSGFKGDTMNHESTVEKNISATNVINHTLKIAI